MKRLTPGPLSKALATLRGQRWLAPVLVLLGAAVAGWLVSLAAYPAPLVAKEQRVALVIGLPQSEAEKAILEQGFRVKFREAREADPALPAGHVVWQDPPAGLELPSGSMVELTLSDGPAQVPVPDVMYFDLEEARRVMTAAGLAVGGIDSVPADIDRGVVVSTRPPEGTLRAPGARVDLVVSRGPAAVRIPEVAGLTELVARERIEAAGLRIGLVTKRRDNRGKPGAVLSQRPNPGSFLPKGGRVDLVVNDSRPR
jgi:serine/threonine-protein kinase